MSITGIRNRNAFPRGSFDRAVVSLVVILHVEFQGGTSASEGEGEGSQEGYLGHGAGGKQGCAEEWERERGR